MAYTKNALKELAGRLGRVIIPHPKTRIYNDLLKAYLIIAELAKVGDEEDYSKSPYDYKRVCREAYEECREIAEKGDENEGR